MKETNLKKWRTIRNMTQKELAKRAGISIRTLQDYEQGRKSINGAAAITVCKLAEELACEPVELLEDYEDWFKLV
jgi:transcriptional regulator with XRE-family HTH domain